VHIDCQSTVADNCSAYALSDTTDVSFKQQCEHQHNEQCVTSVRPSTSYYKTSAERHKTQRFVLKKKGTRLCTSSSQHGKPSRHGRATSSGQCDKISHGWMSWTCWVPKLF
ncbi:hypothetical protein OS493_019442, partial [Desmophyllum pertusum]